MIQSGTISNTATDLLVVPAGRKYTTLLVAICNNGTALQNFDIYAVKAGDTPSTTNRIIANRTVKSYDSFFMIEKFMLEEGDRISALASNNGALTATVSWAVL